MAQRYAISEHDLHILEDVAKAAFHAAARHRDTALLLKAREARCIVADVRAGHERDRRTTERAIRKATRA
jgi:hypothetical protein